MDDGQPASGEVAQLRAELEAARAELAARDQQLRLALSIGAVVIWDIDLTTSQVHCTADLSRFGLDASRPLSPRELRRLLHPEDQVAFGRQLRALAAGESGGPHEWRLVRPDGMVEWLSTRAEPVRDTDGRVVRLLAVSTVVTALKQTQGELAETNTRLMLALDAAQMTIWEQDLRSGIIRTYQPNLASADGGGARLREVSADATERVYERIHPEDAGRFRTMRSLDLDEQARFSLEYRVVRRDGSQRIRMARGQVHSATAELPARLIGVAVDVTEDRRIKRELETALRHREMLLKEVNHRIKNSLQMISSLLSLQAAGVSDPSARTLFEDALLRVRAVGMLHQRLYQTENVEELELGAYLSELAQNVVKSVAGDSGGIDLVVSAEPFVASPDTAISLALMLNELLINAVKHAYPEGKGEVRVFGVNTDGAYCLRIEDDGVGLPPQGGRQGLGSRMVGALSRQLGGTLSRPARARGHAVEVSVPVERLAPVVRAT